MAENGSLSQDEIDALLSMGDDDSQAGGGEELNLDSLLAGGEDGSSVGLDQESLNALAGAVGGGAPAPARSAGGVPSQGAMGGENRDNVDLLMDVTLHFTVELGRTTMLIKDVFMLGEGSIVELDKNVGDEVDILVNDRLFGRGKLIVIDEYFGVQITHILDPLDRFRAL